LSDRASYASFAARPAAAERSDPVLASDMPANQSSPSAPNGAMAAALTTASTRSGSSAPHASACAPPPECPNTAKRSIPSASAIAATSSAAEPTVRPGSGVEPP
jgi:hypothetical protein